MRPVRVKREGTDSSVPDDEEARACPEPDAVVKTEDMEVSCKAEPAEVAGAQMACTRHSVFVYVIPALAWVVFDVCMLFYPCVGRPRYGTQCAMQQLGTPTGAKRLSVVGVMRG